MRVRTSKERERKLREKRGRQTAEKEKVGHGERERTEEVKSTWQLKLQPPPLSPEKSGEKRGLSSSDSRRFLLGLR
jgi:hypothetical protein